MAKKAPIVPFEDTEIDVWFERDRAHVVLVNIETEKPIIEWRDEEVGQAIEDGFLDMGNSFGSHIDERSLHESAYDYAVHLGLIREE